MSQFLEVVNGTTLFLGLPDFIWSGIFSLATTFVAGIVVAGFASSYLKRKEERARISGVIFEKRIAAERELSTMLVEKLLYSYVELGSDSPIADQLDSLDISDTHTAYRHSTVFNSPAELSDFIDSYRTALYRDKMWLGSDVRDQLLLIQYYLEGIGGLDVFIDRVPLPDGVELSDSERSAVLSDIVVLCGVIADNDLNAMLGSLDNSITRSLYKIDFGMPKSAPRLRDHRRIVQVALEETEFGINFYEIICYIAVRVLEVKGLELAKDVDFFRFVDDLVRGYNEVGGALEDPSKDGYRNYSSRCAPKA